MGLPRRRECIVFYTSLSKLLYSPSNTVTSNYTSQPSIFRTSQYCLISSLVVSAVHRETISCEYTIMGSTLRRTDLLALSNLRNDGRKPHEIRRMRVEITEQGALVEMGLTTVLATVRGPIECTRRSEEVPDRYVVEGD